MINPLITAQKSAIATSLVKGVDCLDLIYAQEAFAKRNFGISVKYDSNPFPEFWSLPDKLQTHLVVAREINQRLLDLARRGYDLPNVALGTTIFKQNAKPQANGLKKKFSGYFSLHSPKDIFINPYTFRKFNVDHEVGHFLHCKKLQHQFQQIGFSHIAPEEKKLIETSVHSLFPNMPRNSIEEHFLYFTKNVTEFIAFCFERKMAGWKLPKEYMDIYDKYYGPKILK